MARLITLISELDGSTLAVGDVLTSASDNHQSERFYLHQPLGNQKHMVDLFYTPHTLFGESVQASYGRISHHGFCANYRFKRKATEAELALLQEGLLLHIDAANYYANTGHGDAEIAEWKRRMEICEKATLLIDLSLLGQKP